MRKIYTILLMTMIVSLAKAQITIGGSVYGGGNEGKVESSTSVTIYAGDLNSVYGGARKADVGGSAFVHIDGEHASDSILINAVYGGNDISGTVGTTPGNALLPEALKEATANGIDNSWNAFIRTSRSTKTVDGETVDDKKIFIGRLFGGGNGDYDYKELGLSKPELGKTYLELCGGTIVHVYGGGNAATVTENTTICIDNESEVVKSMLNKDGQEMLTAERLAKMSVNSSQTNLEGDFQFARVFGGNNKADMAIMPKWDLRSGLIRDLYSGGNEGRMTSPEGLLLEIKEGSKIVVDNVYGGCRRADVFPMRDNELVVGKDLQLSNTAYKFPAGLAARVIIRDGDINNVYGGNDISGKVFGGNAIGIYASIRGDVYGGGNGSYAYTDNAELGLTDTYRDYYYDPGTSSVDALNAFRPNAEQVSLRLWGKSPEQPTVIGGAVYCGGNSATLKTDIQDPIVELKIGSYVIADTVFLGNNGKNMVSTDILKQYANEGISDFSQMTLTDSAQFATYMEGVTMDIMPQVVFDTADTDPQEYIDYTTQIGSLYCGGNIGSMNISGKNHIDFKHKIIIFDKVVGGCNSANVAKSAYNAAYAGGLLGNPDENGDKLQLDFEDLKIQPKRWNADHTALVWNTISASTGEQVDFDPTTASIGQSSAADLDRRLMGGNIYGGCYQSGHINGNVIINLNGSVIQRDNIFDEVEFEGSVPKLYDNSSYNITQRHSGVILDEQGMDALGTALNVYGGGYGEDSEIWGSTTINLNKGYAFQVFGGGEAGVIGKKNADGTYKYDPAYSTYVNLRGVPPGVPRGDKDDSTDMAECEFIYGGGFQGLIAGDTHVNLGNGRIFNSFAGSCNADILGHTETYIGRNGVKDDGTDVLGFPWIRDHVYGGNDLGGSIHGEANFKHRVHSDIKDQLYGYDANGTADQDLMMLKAAAYMEYQQGRVDNIFGGCYGDYDYSDDKYATRVSTKPYLRNSFVNIRPTTDKRNILTKVFGAGQGTSGDREGDKAQDYGYVLVDIPEGLPNFKDATEVFGAGAYDGLGMRNYLAPDAPLAERDAASAVIDLVRGDILAAYGGAYNEGITRRTVVNVPEKSTINITNIFGGAYGNHILPPCDVYEANVNYRSGNAFVNGAIYGGNNNVRRTLYAKVNISAPVRKSNGYSTTVYGAGRGMETWAEYTEVNLEKGANVWEVYGGGEMGNVLNAESIERYMQTYVDQPADKLLVEDDDQIVKKNWDDPNRWVGGAIGGTLKDDYKEMWKKDWKAAWTLGDYYTPDASFSGYIGNTKTNLENPLVRTAEMDDRSDKTYKYNTNVLIHEGAYVGNYAYGGGYGDTTKVMSGSVYGTTYIALLGGTVNKDIYAAGTAGSVTDIFGVGAYSAANPTGFTASANVFIEGGMARNVYGGGWRGGVGYHEGLISNVANNASDRDGESHVVVGKLDGTSFVNGIPAINRNIYGGGEGGAIYGTAYVTLNNGQVGYRYKDGNYQEELDDATKDDNQLDESGNIFGGGYVANSYVDASDVKMYGGVVRGSIYGGGEVGPIGRGTVKVGAVSANAFINGSAKIYKAGQTHVALYGGQVKRNVFGGGRGHDNWGGEGWMTDDEKKTMDLSSKGYVFGTTDVNIHGGSIGTLDGLGRGFGNVFGGGDLGFVYGVGKKLNQESKKGIKGYYYKYQNNSFTEKDNEYELTEDCRVNIKAMSRATAPLSIGGKSYAVGDTISNETLNTLSTFDEAWSSIDQSGITIHNAIFAGGNVSAGSNQVFAFSKTVFGNATAAVVDVFGRDLVSVGGDGIGGIYGDGNLTFVDGYRELNISNYGTDFYALPSNMDLTNPKSLEEYNKLTDRQRAIYVVKYKFDGNPEGNVKGLYEAGDIILTDEYNKLTDTQKSHWTAVHSVINEGRYINTIQRSDFCGIIGSRLVLRGAMDRAQNNNVNDADYTNYTINRVGELSLNQWHGNDGITHGCYFGIYNVVKLLGAVTSDVKFTDTRETSSTMPSNQPTSETETYWDWKDRHRSESNVNNGSSMNKIALASGVYLDIVKNILDDGTKKYGPITGIVELDLLNVTPGEGGGYVYAENIHGERDYDESKAFASVLSEANHAQGGCRTNAGYTYSNPSTADDLETSGNFVSSLKDIVDDCFPTSKSWVSLPDADAPAAPAHYWYIRGEFYVYNQEVSAYTGSADAYSAEISIPLTMVAQSNARLRLLNVLPGLYADPTQFDASKSYYDADLGTWKSDSLEIAFDNVTKRFGQNDPISYWDWYMTNKGNQARFVTETYTCIEQVTVGGTTYYPGQGILKETFLSLKDVAGTDANDREVANAQEKFRITNGMSHDKGFVLTLDMTNPSRWNDYYTHITDHLDKKSSYQWSKLTDEQKANYLESATFLCNNAGTYGQYYFNEDDIISQAIYNMQTDEVKSNTESETQASFERAYVAVDSCEVVIGGTLRIMQQNARISASTWSNLTEVERAHFAPAKICSTTFNVSDTELYVVGQVVANNSTVASGIYATNFSDAWYCVKEGSWGGKYYVAGQNYRGKDYCQLLEQERQNFTYNYDALDLLVADFTQNGSTYPTVEELTRIGTDRNRHVTLYDGDNAIKHYGVSVNIDYDATYKGTGKFNYVDDSNTVIEVKSGVKLESADYQNLPNDFAHYATIHVNDNHLVTDAGDDNGKYIVYVVWNTFDVGGTMYNAGKTITKADYDGLGALQENVHRVVMTKEQVKDNTTGVFYYCIEDYLLGDKDKYMPEYTSPDLLDINAHKYHRNDSILVGTIISSSEMSPTNYQRDFEVSGEIPTEQTTLYVPVTADYTELQKDRYVTAIFEYTYTESDAQGLNFETRVEKHILNLCIRFKSGKPIIGKIKEPSYVLPLEAVGIDIPFIQEEASAFPILKGGFEIYDNEADAIKHQNGREFACNTEPVYFYQDMNYVAYYAETRLGRTYSDPVPIHVANYQRMADVINDENHMYLNHRLLKRNPKIYIDNVTVTGKGYNELDAMKEMFDIVNSDYGKPGKKASHGRDITGAKGLDFFVQNQVAATRPWTPIGDNDHCFMGNFHGNGFTLSNLSASLFGHLCGNVYNTGVMGSFTSGGIADTGSGRIENAWVSTTATPTGKAVYSSPDADAVVINSYYPESQAFTTHTDANIEVTKRPVSDFQNGRVTYDLNRYYLEARYNLFTEDANVNTAGNLTNQSLFRLPNGTLQTETRQLAGDKVETWPVTHTLYYPADYAWHLGAGPTNTTKKYGYVESLYEDGDFRFADGQKPQTADMRMSEKDGYLPIFPDDYLFFGQRLSYNLYANRQHDNVPTGVIKDHTVTTTEGIVDNTRSGLLTTATATENRVYRAPAYFGNGTFGRSAVFNANAAFAATWQGAAAHQGMTAIDFSGGNGDTNGYQDAVAGTQADYKDRASDYAPLLDFERIDSMRTTGLTQNLLAYAPDVAIANTSNQQTAAKLSSWANDVVFSEHYLGSGSSAEHGSNAVTVVAADTLAAVAGHVVLKSGAAYTAPADHFLVDDQAFNAPLAYQFVADRRMWYQREPEHYASFDGSGWDAISLPFTTELVTTQTKGELTHFFEGDKQNHEYWLRCLTDARKKDDTTIEGTFDVLSKGTESKPDGNTFLWDYYYQQDDQQDKNTDKYQTYYKEPRWYDNYPRAAAATPYLIGLPGADYYEFDLSGEFIPAHSYSAISELPRQVVTFASATGGLIEHSDQTLASRKVQVTVDGQKYEFRPLYSDTTLTANAYVLNAEGSSFDVVTSDTQVRPFRPYFLRTTATASARRAPQQIVFTNSASQFGIQDRDQNTHGALNIYAKKGRIVVESTLARPHAVRNMTPAGVTLTTFTIQPGETIETRIHLTGVYLVNNKKLRVSK